MKISWWKLRIKWLRFRAALRAPLRAIRMAWVWFKIHRHDTWLCEVCEEAEADNSCGLCEGHICPKCFVNGSDGVPYCDPCRNDGDGDLRRWGTY